MKNITIYFSVLLLFLFVGLSPVYAGLDEGLFAYERGDYETAFQEFKPLAEKEDAVAQYGLGLMYYYGEGVPQDYILASKWYKQAAAQELEQAQNNLGVMYYYGQGVPKDYAEAFKWYKQAAEQGNAMSQKNLGVLYGLGEGVPKNFVIAYMWSNLAASQGQENASKYRSILKKEMTPEQIAEAQRLSREFNVKKPPKP